ncbi:MAG: transcriptional regulator NrdR [Armatimonadota bacterium]
MKCPFCSQDNDKVLESRSLRAGESIKRRRECIACGRRFTTYEYYEEPKVMVVKRDGRREPFDRAKLLKGMTTACQKRPVSIDDLQGIIEKIESFVFDTGSNEIDTEKLGELVAESLKELDQVAYVRFVSVYLQFEDVKQFNELVNKLRDKRRSSVKSKTSDKHDNSSNCSE